MGPDDVPCPEWQGFVSAQAPIPLALQPAEPRGIVSWGLSCSPRLGVACPQTHYADAASCPASRIVRTWSPARRVADQLMAMASLTL